MIRASDVLARIVEAMQVSHATSGCPRRLSRQHAWQECAWTPSVYAAADALDAADAGGTPEVVARALHLRVQEAREALQLAWDYRDAYAEEAERLLAEPMTEHETVIYWRQVFGVDAVPNNWTPRVKALSERREDRLTSVLASPTCDFGRGTAYAAFQAVTEYADHYSRGKDEAAPRPERVMTGSLDRLKVRAHTLALRS